MLSSVHAVYDRVTLDAGLAGYGTQICMTIALQYCKAAQAIAMSYLSVVWGKLLRHRQLGVHAVLFCSSMALLDT